MQTETFIVRLTKEIAVDVRVPAEKFRASDLRAQAIRRVLEAESSDGPGIEHIETKVTSVKRETPQ